MNMTPYNQRPPKPPKRTLSGGITEDARKKPVKVGDIVGYSTADRSSSAKFNIIKSIDLFEDYHWDNSINNYRPYVYSEVRFETTRCVRSLNAILKLEQ